MGTRGYKIIRFRGRYWIFYNHWDSYPEGLGQWLVDSIPADPEQYQKWLQSQRDAFAKKDALLHQILTVQHDDMRKLLSDEPHKPVFYAAFDEKLQANAPPHYTSAFNDLYIEWVYTIDLDREVFSIDNGAHFRLDQVPSIDVWDEAFFNDINGNRFLLPQLVPSESVAMVVLDPPRFLVSTHDAKLQTALVTPKKTDRIQSSYLTGSRLRWMLFDIVQESLQEDLSVSLLSWQAQDLPFRELVFFILCLATGGEHLTLLDQRRMKIPYSGALYLGITTDNSPEPSIELASCLGVGYHMADLPIGSAPEETKYWFDGALICLVPRLDCAGVLEEAIADAMEYGRAKCTASSFNAVLISIEHIVLIKSFPDGTVDHTEPLPLILITSHLSKDPRGRYGDEALEAFHAACYGPGSGNVKLIAPIPVKDVSIRSTFMALMQFFEAITLETLRPIQPNEARLPDEICEMVLQNVSDMKTYNSCLKVSRRFRLICQQRPLLTDNIVLLEPLPKEHASLITDEEEKEKTIGSSHPPADFLAVDLSSDRQMEVLLRSGTSRGDALNCRVVAGKEWNRKTYVNHSISFLGLRVPTVDADKAGQRERHTAVYGYNEQLTYIGSEGTAWEPIIKVSRINIESETRRIGEFWTEVTREFNHRMGEYRKPAWTLPANTLCYFGTQATDTREGNVRKFFHYLYLRVKRLGMDRNSQWDDIIGEAAEHLNQTEDKKEWYRPQGGVIGADEPYVILTIGLDVRLFQWIQGFDETVDEEARRERSPSSHLRELGPGKVLNICERSDRDEIEKFLEMANQHKEAIKARDSESYGKKTDWH